MAPGAPPSFSIVIAAYQVAPLIGRALDSALAQTLPPVEVVVCDDGSTDDLAAALAPYRDRIVVVRHHTNRGEGAAKNAAVQAASGDFVAILDADDAYFPDRLEALAELSAARPDLDILTTDAYLELDGRRVRRCYEGGWTFDVRDQRRAILERNFIFGLAAVRRTAMLRVGGFDERIRWTTDWDLWVRLILAGSRAGAVDRPLAVYRLRPSSLSAHRSRLLAGRLQTLEKAAAHPDLDASEREAVGRTIAARRQELVTLALREALVARAPDRRRRALDVVRAGGVPPRTRLKAVAAAAVPGVVGRLLERREGGAWTAAGGTKVGPQVHTEPADLLGGPE